ncbi:hypothetical protein vBSenS3_101 [Salmonella phage vB_SenS-3]|nr:hypothetical protein vBSenS3_101 [Salmonella phage vB_SenS-3]
MSLTDLLFIQIWGIGSVATAPGCRPGISRGGSSPPSPTKINAPIV